MSGQDDETFLSPRIVYFVLKLTDILPGLVLSIFSELENTVKCPHLNLEARTSGSGDRSRWPSLLRFTQEMGIRKMHGHMLQHCGLQSIQGLQWSSLPTRLCQSMFHSDEQISILTEIFAGRKNRLRAARI